MSTYRVLPLDDTRFAVADTADEYQFVGSLAECEEWLDAIERQPNSAEEAEPKADSGRPIPRDADPESLWSWLKRRLFG